MELQKATWAEFRDNKLLWWVNRSLHIFGWCIVIQHADSGEITEVYPARTDWRGFPPEVEAEGFETLTKHFAAEKDRLLREVKR